MKTPAILLAFCCLGFLQAYTQNLYDARQSVMLEASVQENPPRVVLHWVKDTANGGYNIWRKAKSDAQWGNRLDTVGPGSTMWADSSVVAGIPYEYQVLKSLPAYPYGNGTPNFGAGYIYAGIQVPPTHRRGACLVVIDSTFKQTLAQEIARLLTDIQADGWAAQALYVNRNNSVPVVKSHIKSWADTKSDENLALFLLGRVPVPYSGEIAPDGHHSDHRGAWPCDGYYANLDGVWTDNTINITTAASSRNDNVPGDGKFDQTHIPTPVRLQVGRVDFSNMNKFPETETQLLRRYLDKDHAWRSGKTLVLERGLVDNNFPALLEGLGMTGWRNFTTMFGYSKVKDLPYRQTLSNQSYMWSYGCGGGGPESASDISSTSNFAVDSLQTVFTLLFGSYFGDWDYPNDFLRGAIASRTCLASTWANRPEWLLHHMALGEPIGYSTLVTMNNRGLYTPPYYGGYVHTALMGDPTLRMHIEKPVESLSAIQAGLHVQLTWQDPAGAPGYYLYKKTASDTSFLLLNQSPLTGSSFLDSCAGAGPIVYMLRRVALRSSASGTYYNLSAGVTSSIVSNPAPFYAQAAFSPSVFYDALTLSNTSLNSQAFQWSFGDGATSTALHPDHLYVQPGNYSICLTAVDVCQSDTTCQPISILSSLPQVSATVNNASCFGTASGSITLQTAGGAPSPQFEWSNLSGTGSSVQGLAAGEYFCTVTSSTGNSAVYGPFVVDQPAAWTLSPEVTMANAGQSNGAVSLFPQGGCPPYSYNWDSGQNSSSIQGLAPGVYCVTISDCQGCSEVYCATVELVSSASTLPELTSHRLYPNPLREKMSVELNFETEQVLTLEVVDAQGKTLAEQPCRGKEIRLLWDLRFLPAGNYWLRVRNANGAMLLPFSVGE